MKHLITAFFILITQCLISQPDTIYYRACPGSQVILQAQGGTLYEWEDGSKTDTLEVTAVVGDTYELTVLDGSGDLVVNGDFSDGYNSFNYGYTQYSGTADMGAGVFWVGPDANQVHGTFRGFDHTTGSGIEPDNFLVANGSSNAGTVVWEQEIAVEPNTDYAFSCWTTNVVDRSPAILQFSVNGTQLGDMFSTVQYTEFDQFYEEWNSGTNTTATITILNQNTTSAGNDFGIDDILFQKISRTKIIYKIVDLELESLGWADEAVVCDSEPYVLEATPSANYLWNDSYTGQSREITEEGVYAVTVTMDGCTSSASQHVRFDNCSYSENVIKYSSCLGDDVVLHAMESGLYEWPDGSIADSLVVSTDKDSSVRLAVLGSGDNMVVNGDFSAGKSGFTTAYNDYDGSGVLWEGDCWVGPDAMTVHKDFRGYDHTKGSGAAPDNFLVVNGASNSGTILWQQNISIQPNTEYAFSCWLMNVTAGSPAQLQFSITADGRTDVLGDIFLTPTYKEWHQFYDTWNSGGSYTATITILNQNSSGSGNDFGIDDISFSPISRKTVLYEISVLDPSDFSLPEGATICEGSSVVVDAGYAGASYEWQDGSTEPHYTVSGAGTYSVTVTVAGCTASDEITFETEDCTPRYDTVEHLLCKGNEIVLHGEGGVLYEWEDGSNADSLVVTTEVDSLVSLKILTGVKNLVVNGGFDDGDSGFSSDYSYTSDGTLNDEGVYAVTDAAGVADMHWQFRASDRTDPDGLFMAVNGASSSNAVVWEQTVAIEPFKDYSLSCWTTNLHDYVPAELQFMINGVQLGAVFSTDKYTTEWDLFYEVWNSGSNETATITILNKNISPDGNDFALDDISFQAVGEKYVVHKIMLVENGQLGWDESAVICPGESLVLDAEAVGATYEWSVAGHDEASLTVNDEGVYSVTVTQSGCVYSDEISVSFNAEVDVDLGKHISSDVAVTIDAGAGFDSYEWNTGDASQTIMVTETGKYMVRVSQNGCTDFDEIEVFMYEPMSLELVDSVEFCEGESDTLIPEGNGPRPLDLVLHLASNGTAKDKQADFDAEIFGASLVEDRWGNQSSAYQFNGTNQYMSIERDDAFNSENLSFGAYVKFGDLNQSIGSILANTEQSGYSLLINPKQGPYIRASIRTGIGYVNLDYPTSNLNTTDWFHFFVTLSDNRMAMYVNGQLVDEAEVSAAYVPSPTNLFVGAEPNPSHAANWFFNGSIDDVRVYSEFLTDDEVALLYDDKVPFRIDEYKYEWSTGETTDTLEVAEAGEYIVTATLGAVSMKDTVTVSVLPIPASGLDAGYEFCESDTLFVEGANSTASYLWSDGTVGNKYAITDEGEYTVVVSEAGCSIEEKITVIKNLLPHLNLGNDTSICRGAAVIFDAGVSDLSAQYLWSNGATDAEFEVSETGEYAVTVSSNGCVVADTVKLEVKEFPRVDSLPDYLLCDGQKFSIEIDNPNGYLITWNETIVSDTYQSKGVTETILLSVANDECVVYDTAEVVMNNSLTIDLGADKTICEDDTLKLEANMEDALYEWNDGSTSPVIEVTQGGVYAVTVTVDGCSGEDEIIVTELAYPVFDTLPDQQICEGQTYIYELNVADAAVEWHNGSTAIRYEASKNETVIVRVSNVACSVFDTAEVVLHEIPVVDLGVDQDICEGQSINLNVSLSDAEYLWNNGETAANIELLASGTYSVTVSKNGCTSSDEMKLTVHPLPAVNLGDDFAICQNKSIVLDAQNAGSDFLWSDNSTSQSITIDSPGLYGVTVTKNECSAFDELTVTEVALPEVIIPDATICSGQSHRFDAHLDGAGITYAWSNGPTTAINELTQAGVYTLTVSDNGCDYVTSAKLSVVEYPKPILENISLCQGNGVNETYLFDLGGLGETYLWHDGSSASTYLASGAEVVSVSVANGDCESKAQSIVSVITVPEPDLGADISVCDDEAVLLDPAVTITGIAYEWNDGSRSPTLTVSQTGTYSVTVTNQQCKVSASVQVEIVDTPDRPIASDVIWCANADAVPLLSAKGNNVVWYSDIQLNILESSDNIFMPSERIPGIYTYYVTQSENGCESDATVVDYEVVTADGSMLSIVGDVAVCEFDNRKVYTANGAINNFDWGVSGELTYSGGNESILVDFYSAGLDTISLTSIDFNGCEITEELVVAVAPQPVADFVWNSTEIEGEVEYRDLSTQDPIFDKNYNRLMYIIDYDWHLALVDSNDYSIALDRKSAIGVYDYGYYEVSLAVENEFGCRDSITKEVFVEVYTGLYVPNAFNPGHQSQLVGTFKPIGINLAEYSIKIYDNWGNLVWYSDRLDENGSPLEAWDGTYKGEQLGADVYTWYIDAVFEDGDRWEGQKRKNGKMTHFGDLILIR